MRKPSPFTCCLLSLVFALCSTPANRLQAQIINTVAGISSAGYTGDGGPATAASTNNAENVAVDSAGNIYIADGGNLRIRKINTSGIISTYAGTGAIGYSGDGGPATAATFYHLGSIKVDISGNLFVADVYNNCIRKINTSGIITTVAGNGLYGYSGDGGPATATKLAAPSDIAIDKNGNLLIADTYNYRIRKVSTSGIITTIAGTGTNGFNGDGGAATATQFSIVYGICCDSADNIYVADFYNQRVRKINTANVVSTIAGNGIVTNTVVGGPATAASLSSPYHVAVDSFNNIYVTNYGNAVYKVDASGYLSRVAGSGSFGGGFSGDGGPATDANLLNADGLAIDKYGYVFVQDPGTQRLRKFGRSCSPVVAGITGWNTLMTGDTLHLADSTSGGSWSSSNASMVSVSSSGVVYGVGLGSAIISYTVSNSCGATAVTHAVTVEPAANPCNMISTIAGNGTVGYSGDGGPATSANIYGLSGTLDTATGNYYIADYLHNRIRKVSLSGIITTVAGNGTAGFSGDGGAATAAQLYNPLGVCVDASGDLLIADNGNQRIRKVTPAGIISTIAGNGPWVASGDGGPATAASLQSPYCVVSDVSGNIFIGGNTNGSIRKINPSGNISTYAGTGDLNYGVYGEGVPATNAVVGAVVYGMCTDASGNFYFTDNFYSTLRKVSPAGIITTVAGLPNRPAGFSGDGGPASSAQLCFPYGVTIDYLGNIYIADGSNSRVRKIAPSGLISTIAGNGSWYDTGDGGPAAAAGVRGPSAVSSDTSGNIYIYDGAFARKVTIIPPPVVAPISGDSIVCAGDTTRMHDATPSGTWSSSDTLIAAIDSTGLLRGRSAGTAIISYSVANSCTTAFDTALVTVDPPLPPVTGANFVCAGSSITLIDSVAGGAWSSSDTTIAIINNSGLLTGVRAGTCTITYSRGRCYSTILVTVGRIPAPITGLNYVCLGNSITLVDTTTGGNWSSSNTAIATISSGGIVTGIAPGSDTIYYTLPTGCGVSFAITVNDTLPPITGVTHSCIGFTTMLYDAVAGGTWSSSNNTIATTTAATGIVTGVAAGTVTISYVKGGCFITTGFTVNTPSPSVITPIGDTMLCPGGFVILTGPTFTTYTYQWYNGASPISGETSSIYITYGAGNYRLEITNGYGCVSSSSPMAVTMNPVTALATATGATTVCGGSSVGLSTTTGTGLSYQWATGGGGIAGATNPTYGATATGSYYVVVTNAAGCSAASSPVYVTVLPAPTNTLTVYGATSFCSGDSVTIAAPTGSGLTYQWQVGGVNIAGATDSTYTAGTSGNYQLVVTNSYPCSATSAIVAVTSFPLPSANITVAGSPIFSSGSSVSISTVAGAGNTYQWMLNGSPISGATNVTYSASSGGNYTVKVVTPTGCTDTTTSPQLLTEIGAPYLVALSSVNHCWGGTTLLEAHSSTTIGIAYQWQYNGTDIAGATNSTYGAGPTGYYSCVISFAACGCSSGSSWIEVTELAMPNPVVTYDGTYLKTDTGFLTYQWSRNSVVITGANTNTYLPTSTGYYSVEVANSGGCRSISPVYPLTVLHHGGTGVAVINKDDIKIFPNPAQNIINIVANAPLRAVMTTVDGRKVIDSKDAQTIDISLLADGIYILMLYDADGIMVKAEKITKE